MKCPGQDMQYWKDDAIFEVKCPECSSMVEFYKDDTTRKCHKCDHRFVNPNLDFGCATYCQFAEQCLGTLPEEFVMQHDSLLKDKVAVEMKRYFGTDFKQISRTTKLARYAENIGKSTEDANLAVLLCSAYLLRIGYTSASQKHGDTSDQLIRQENVALAAEILGKLKANQMIIDSVSSIIGPTTDNGDELSLEHNIINDSNHLTWLEEAIKDDAYEQDYFEKIFSKIVTTQGKTEGKKLLSLLANTF